MLNTEILWNKALTDNSVRVIIRWLQSLTTEGKSQRDVDKSLAKFNCWLQCSMGLTKKELLTFCVGQCHGLWMFLDQTSYTKLCLLIQKLQNLLLLAHWVSGHACVVCRVNVKAMTRCGCWNLDLHALRQHILLGRLVQWWSFSGLLPQYPDANKLKHISQMWREMSQHHKTTSLELRCNIVDESRWSSIIHGMVADMYEQYGPLWVSEDCTSQTYPPPSLYSLLKIVLVPNTNTTSALAIIMYCVLHVSKMQCKSDLLKSFCHFFGIPSKSSKQIYGLWLLDHGFVSNSLEKLLSQEPGSAWLSWHSYAVIRTLLRQDQRQAALKYLYYSMPAIEHTQDARLYMDVLLQNNHVAEALILLKRCLPGSEYLLTHFICSCQNLGEDVLASIRKEILNLKILEGQNSSNPDEIHQKNPSDEVEGNTFVVKGHAPSPLSALLYQCLFSGSLTSADLLRLFREAVTELNSSNKHTRMMVVWPTYFEKTKENKNFSQSPENFLSCSLSPVELQKEETDFELLQTNLMEVHVSPACASSGSTSPHSMESACSFLCSPSVSPAEWRQEETTDEERSSLSDNHMPSKAVTQCCSHITLPVGEAPEAMLIKSSSRENIDEQIVSNNALTGTIPGNVLDSAYMVDVTQTEESNKDKQTMPIGAAMIAVDGDIFFMPDFEKIIDDAREPHEGNKAEDESGQFSVLSSERVYCQDSICDEASGSSSFLDLKPLRRALPCSPLEKSLRSFHYDSHEGIDQPEILTSCAVTETMQGLLEQNLTLEDEEPFHPSSLVSVRRSILVMDFNPVRRDSYPHQLQSSFGVPLLPSSPSENTKGKAASEGRSTGIREVVCFRTTSDRVGDYKLGSWWKQALETRRASAGLLPSIEQIPAVTKEKRHSLVIGWPQSYGLNRGCKEDIKQATKEELSSRKTKGKMDNWYKQS